MATGYDKLSKTDRFLMTFCRILTALCILADGIWYITSYDVRVAYMKSLGLPIQFVGILAVVHFYLGLRLLINYSVEYTCTAMIVAYGIIAFIVHHPVGDGGIGEYPKHINREVNLLNILKYGATIGGLFLVLGYHDFKLRRHLMEGTKSYAIILGRASIGIHYVIESFWFRLYQHELRTKQINVMGGDPILHVWIVGCIYFFGGLNIWFGSAWRRKFGALLLAVLTAALTFLEGSKVATSLGIFHMKPQARFHHVVVNFQIILGCLMIFATGGQDPVSYKRDD